MEGLPALERKLQKRQKTMAFAPVLICLIPTYTVVLFVWGWSNVVDPWLGSGTVSGSVSLFVGGCFAVLSLVSLFRTLRSDPGPIPVAWQHWDGTRENRPTIPAHSRLSTAWIEQMTAESSGGEALGGPALATTTSGAVPSASPPTSWPSSPPSQGYMLLNAPHQHSTQDWTAVDISPPSEGEDSRVPMSRRRRANNTTTTTTTTNTAVNNAGGPGTDSPESKVSGDDEVMARLNPEAAAPLQGGQGEEEGDGDAVVISPPRTASPFYLVHASGKDGIPSGGSIPVSLSSSASVRGPGTEPLLASHQSERNEVDLDVYPARWCRVCETFKPPRTHHCSTCARCVLRMDHHCFFLNKCIGASNLKFFILFLIYTTLGLTYVVLLTVWSLLARIMHPSPPSLVQPQSIVIGANPAATITFPSSPSSVLSPNLQHALAIAFLIIPALFFIKGIGKMTRLHLRLLKSNISQIENLHDVPTALHRHDTGDSYSNVALVMGDHPLLWGLPI